jgi:hypothetical protein
MKTSYLFTLCLYSIFSLTLYRPVHADETYAVAVTYDYDIKARLGDNLMCYLHAKWVSYKNGIPILYKPFPYSDLFTFDEVETRYSLDKKTDKIVLRAGISSIEKQKKLIKRNAIFIIPYFPESFGEREIYRMRNNIVFPYFQVDWKEEKFRAILKEMLKPKKPVELLECPRDKLTVAIHCRMGGGFDREGLGEDPLFAGKLPPVKFYLDALNLFCKLCPTEDIYFHVFTDDAHPERLAFLIEDHVKSLRSAPFSVGYRTKGNSHRQNILEDMFSMMQFDCLIRPESNFSIIPSLLKEYKILIHPDIWYTKGDLKYMKLKVTKN